MRNIKINADTFETLKNECSGYTENIIDLDEKMEYSIELDRCHNLNQLVKSSVFRDACGKVVKLTETELIINEE